LLCVLLTSLEFSDSKAQAELQNPQSEIESVLEATIEPEGIRVIVKLKNLSKKRVEIYGANYPFGNLEIAGKDGVAWRQVGTVDVSVKPALNGINPGEEIGFDYFIRVTKKGNGFELGMANGESLLSATLGSEDKFEIHYKYSFLTSSRSPWKIGFLNAKSRSVFRGEFASNSTHFSFGNGSVKVEL